MIISSQPSSSSPLMSAVYVPCPLYINNNVSPETEFCNKFLNENEPVVIETSVVNAQHSNESNIRLSPGDVVSVEQTPQTVVHNIFSNIVRFSIVAGRSVPLF